MRARARLGTERDPRVARRPHTRIRVLRSDWPLMLRSTLPLDSNPVSTWAQSDATAARVHLSAGAAGPVGGDQLRLEVHVGPGSSLILSEVSPTLLLPGPHGEQSRTEIDIRVAAGASLAWLPQLVIAAQGCRHHTDVRVTLEPEARLLLREEILLGRHNEHPGQLQQRLRVVLDDRPLYDQELTLGPGAPAWDGPAVTAGNASIGSLLVVDPAGHGSSRDGTRSPDLAVMALPGPGTVVTALATNTATLRGKLDTALTQILTREART